MSTKSVLYTTPSRLSCSCVGGATVVLCLTSSSLLNPVPCEVSTIEATITKTYKDADGCGNVSWRYIFSYDPSLLADPTSALTSADITGVFCKGCLTTWIEEQIACSAGSAVCVSDSTSIDFSIDDDGCVTGDVLISADADNQLSLHSNGLYASGGGGSGWALLGNAGTVDGVNFWGTTDNVPLTARVNNVPGFRLQPKRPGGGPIPPWYNPDFITGPNNNAVTLTSAGRSNAIIGGDNNLITDFAGDGSSSNDCVIAGGAFNEIDACSCCIITGASNFMEFANVSGIVGTGNILQSVEPNGNLSANFIAGSNNSIVSTIVSASLSSILGGGSNSIIDSQESVICGGIANEITSTFNFWVNAIVGGDSNSIADSNKSFIGGGSANALTSTTTSLIGGGDSNSINGGTSSSILGGSSNSIISSTDSLISGGDTNLLDTVNYSTIAGGGRLKLGAQSFGFQNRYNTTQKNLSAFSGIAFFGDTDLWIGNTNSVARKLKLFEPNAAVDYSGTNYSSFEAQAQSADIEYIWPAAAGTVGQSLKISAVSGNRITLVWG